MEIPLGVDVHCTDGRCGRSTHVILNPANEKITHLVVKGRKPSRVERMVPIDWIANTASEVILLNHSREDFEKLGPFRPTDFVYTEIAMHATDPRLTALWSYVVPVKRIVDDTVKRIPPNELAIRRGVTVRATDGNVGRVDEFIVGPSTGFITHLCLREGHIWGQREVSIPVSYIERLDEKAVYLNVDRATIEALPSLPVRRRW